MTGMMFLFDVWIDWTAFATLHFCSVMIVVMAGGLDLMSAVMLKNQLALVTNEQAARQNINLEFAAPLIWVFIGVAIFKTCVGVCAYIILRTEFREAQGHENPCDGNVRVFPTAEERARNPNGFDDDY